MVSEFIRPTRGRKRCWMAWSRDGAVLEIETVSGSVFPSLFGAWVAEEGRDLRVAVLDFEGGCE